MRQTRAVLFRAVHRCGECRIFDAQMLVVRHGIEIGVDGGGESRGVVDGQIGSPVGRERRAQRRDFVRKRIVADGLHGAVENRGALGLRESRRRGRARRRGIAGGAGGRGTEKKENGEDAGARAFEHGGFPYSCWFAISTADTLWVCRKTAVNAETSSGICGYRPNRPRNTERWKPTAGRRSSRWPKQWP